MPKRTERVTVKLTENEKSEWIAASESSIEATDLSDLVRLSVTKEIARQNKEQNQGVGADFSELIDAMNELINPIENQIGEIKNDIRYLELEIAGDDHITSLSSEIYSLLIRVPNRDFIHDVDVTGFEKSDEELIKIKGTKEAFAEYLEITEKDARRALSKCVKDYPDAQRIINDEGKYRYFVVDPQAES